MKLPVLLKEVRACRACAEHLPMGPRPLVQISATARILVIGQAPGRVAHESGVPWNDRSGDRLRQWLGVDREAFYDEAKVALMPMGFCFPGSGGSGDMAPRPECAPLWHDKLLAQLKGVGLTIYIGNYALARYFGGVHDSLTDAVRASVSMLPKQLVLPHPSPRNNIWLKKNPWFEKDVLPVLGARCRRLLAS